MTKDAYFDMCEMLGSDPIDSEIPVDFEDFPIEVQTAFVLYSMLQDNWDGMNGVYMGKILAGIIDIFDIMEVLVADRKMMLQIIQMIDRARIKQIADSRPKDKK